MSAPRIEVYSKLLHIEKKETLKVAGEVPEKNRFKQLKEGKATPLWLVGHLGNTINTVVLRWMLEADSVLTKDQARLFSPDFAGGTPPTTDPEMYPAWEDVVALYDKAMTNAIEGIKKLSDDVLPEPLPGKMPEPMREYFSSYEAVLRIMIIHDSHHRGQISLLGQL